MCLNIIKAVYDKSRANITHNGDRLKSFLPKSGIRQGCPFSPLLFNISTGSLHQSSQRERERWGGEEEREKSGKIEVKMSLFADDIIDKIP